METISITTEDGTEYKFEKPEFECELYGYDGQLIYGKAWSDDGEGVIPTSWFTGGSVSHGYIDQRLTPIKKHWYEDESNFPCLLMKDYGDNDLEFRIAYDYDDFLLEVEENGCRPATKEECMKLIVEV